MYKDHGTIAEQLLGPRGAELTTEEALEEHRRLLDLWEERLEARLKALPK